MGPFDNRELLRLLLVPGIGPQRARALLTHFRTPSAIFSASPRDLIRVPGIDRTRARAIAGSASLDPEVRSQFSRLRSIGGSAVSVWDTTYPPLLKTIYDPPLLLFVRGTLPPDEIKLFALVGTRHPSPYGEAVVRQFAGELVGMGCGIVSGMARGIDTQAHISAINAGGRTIAVLGTGIDIPYPRENSGLMNQIEQNGAVISEFPLGTQPEATNFPRRNRIVSGMTMGTIVVESDVDGGAMITAASALDQNREVFAVPGPISGARTTGPHTLIKEGRAKLVMNAREVLDEFPGFVATDRSRPAPPLPALSLFEQKIFETLSSHPSHIDLIAERAGVGMSETLVALLGLEVKKLARQLPGKFFVTW